MTGPPGPTWQFATSGGLIAAAVAFVLITIGLSILNWQRRRDRLNRGLEALRILIVCLVAFTFLKPERVHFLERTERPEIVILRDRSPSMETADLPANDAWISREHWVSNVVQREFYKPLQARANVVFETFPAATNHEAGTDLSAALEETLQRHRQLRAVLLLSDGDWNSGRSPLAAAARYRASDIPIYSVAVGRGTRLPDVELAAVNPPSYGLLGEQVALPFRLQNHLARPLNTAVTLTSGSELLASKNVRVEPGETLQDLLTWKPVQTGDFELHLRVPVEPDETLAHNNEELLRLQVRRETLRVLLVESLPRWEYRFLRNALSRDPVVQLDTLLWRPGLTPGVGRDYIQSFPTTREALAQYDVVFLGDVGVGPGELTGEQARLVAGLVENQGSGLILMPGPRGRQLTLANGPLADLFPVMLDRARPEGIGSGIEATLQLTSAGREHFLTRLINDPTANNTLWRELPGFHWSAAVTVPRPGAEVLAVHAQARGESGRVPLLVTRAFGSGQVLFMGTDGAWRWRRGVEDKFHYRFWSQIVRWMAHKRHMTAGGNWRVAFTPEHPVAGEPLLIQASARPGTAAASNDLLQATIIGPSGARETFSLSRQNSEWAAYNGRATLREAGPHRLTIGVAGGTPQEIEMLVAPAVREKIGRPANVPMLQELSAISGGKAGDTAALDALVSQLVLLPQRALIEERFRLWSSPWWGGLMIALLALYWTGRKIGGMV